MRDGIGIAVKRPVADHGARAVVEIEHRREAEIDAVRAQLAGDRRRRAASPRARPPATSRSHSSPSVRIGGIAREAVAKALHAAAFVIDGDEQRRSRAARGSPPSTPRAAAADSKLRANRMTPPTSGCARRSRSSAVELEARSTSSITRAARQGDHAAAPMTPPHRGRLAHQRLHLPHRLAHADEHERDDDRVADVQLAHAGQRRDRLHVEIVERVAGVEAHAERAGSPRPPRGSSPARRPPPRFPHRAPSRGRHGHRGRCGFRRPARRCAPRPRPARSSASMKTLVTMPAPASRATTSVSRASCAATSSPPSVVISWRPSGTSIAISGFSRRRCRPSRRWPPSPG